VVQPKAIGPFTFGTAVRAWGGASGKPGAFSITALHARSPEDQKGVSEQSRQIATEMLSMKGFLGFVGVTVGDRMLTISAWEDAEAPRQVMRGGRHAEAMKQFFGTELGGGGYTSVLVPERINTMWVRCPACQKMADHATRRGVCTCGAALPEPIPYW
jgi:heme-degrading monooxygenase HmoA